MFKIFVLLVVAFASFSVAYDMAAQNTSMELPNTPISVERLTSHVKILSSDMFQGRAPGTPGEKMTVDYIVQQLTAIGVSPGGDPDGHGGRRWTQDVRLMQSNIDGSVEASIRTADGGRTLAQGADIAIIATHKPTNRVSIKNAPLVFVGYGVTAKERQWDDFKGIDLRGKIALVLINDPDFEADLGGRFEGKSMTYYGRWTYKYEEAALRGALGILIIHENDPAGYGWDTVKNSFTISEFDFVQSNQSGTPTQLEGWLQRDVAVELFKSAGLNFEVEKKRAQSADFKPVVLGAAQLSVDYAVKHHQMVTKNVIGRLEGSGHAGESVLYSAHWDHLGIGKPDEKGDRIYNGARDNALGVASMLELARVYKAAPRTDRSIIFLALTAEERGLLGSQYYVRHPLYPLETTAAVYNMDGGSTAGPSGDVSVAGDGKVSLQEDLAAAAQNEGRKFSPDARIGEGYFFRMDHFSFAKAGVPAISIGTGQDLMQGGVAAGKAASDAYVNNRYHKASDEWSPDWDLRGTAIDIGLLYQIGRNVAMSRHWPEWQQDSDFKPIRDRSAPARK
jgi:Zn-dependent M28 family amino/carboxypeptidase